MSSSNASPSFQLAVSGSARRPDRAQHVRRLRQLRALLFCDRARLLRFAAVGAVCGLLQLLLLVALKAVGLVAIPANSAAYLLSAQVNFLLSNRFIWHDRWSRQATARDLGRRWIGFHGSIAGTFVLSQVVFVVARVLLPDVAASALGIGVAALANFLIQDRLTFTRLAAPGLRPPRSHGADAGAAAPPQRLTHTKLRNGASPAR